MKHKGANYANYRNRLILLIVALISIAGLIITVQYANKSDKIQRSLSFDWSIDSTDNEEIYVIATARGEWQDGERVGNQYEIELVNNSNHAIRNWNVTIIVEDGCTIDTSWAGFFSLGGDKLMYKPAEFNEYVLPGARKSFGLVMYSPNVCEMNEITLDYYGSRALKSYPAFWIFIVLLAASFVVFIFSEYVRIKMENYTKTHAAYKNLVSESLRTIANIIDTKDEYTKGHSVRVAIYSKMIAERMGMDEHDQERIYYIGLLHDIGKVGIPASILTKPGRLSDEEFEIIKRHPAMGASIMKDFSSIPGVVNGIKYHHERYDGKGYNEHLKGDEIPLEGRIICVADSYDAMSSKRCYRNSLSYDFILDELKRNAGTQFDPDILKHMVAIIEDGYAPVSDAEMEDYEI